MKINYLCSQSIKKKSWKSKSAKMTIGRLDTVAAQNCEKDFKPIFDNADKSITLMLDKLDYVSSSGLRVLLNLRKEVAAKGGTLVLKNLTEEVKSVFVMTGFTKIFTVE